jgi:hypothetical protein
MTETVMISVPRGDDQLADLLEAGGNIDAAMTVRGVKPVVYLWRLSQDENGGYDTYDSCVVSAVDEASAKRVHPSVYAARYDEQSGTWVDRHGDAFGHGDWATHPDQVLAVRIGVSTDQPGRVLCSSFNAG